MAAGAGGGGGDGVDRVSLFFFSWALSRLLCDVSKHHAYVLYYRFQINCNYHIFVEE